MTSNNKIILKKLKELNTIWHPESTLVFKSKEQQLVTGRWENSAFIELDDVALELCDTWKFKVDESLIEQEEEEQVEEEEIVEDEKVDEEQVEDKEESVTEDEPEPVVTTPVVKVEIVKSNNTIQVDIAKAIATAESTINSLVAVPLAKIDQLSTELADTKKQLMLKSSEYDALKLEFEAIKSKFNTLKSLLN
jgi:hypothetical protein